MTLPNVMRLADVVSTYLAVKIDALPDQPKGRRRVLDAPMFVDSAEFNIRGINDGDSKRVIARVDKAIRVAVRRIRSHEGCTEKFRLYSNGCVQLQADPRDYAICITAQEVVE